MGAVTKRIFGSLTFYLLSLSLSGDTFARLASILEYREVYECTCIFLGYSLLLFTSILYLLYIFHYTKKNNLFVVSGLPALALKCTQLLFVSLKVCIFLFLEVLVTPIVAGGIMDLSTLSMFDITVKQRVHQWIDVHLVALFVHWLIGILFITQLGLFLRWSKKTLKKEVLWFVRDTEDPNFNPVTEIISHSVFFHVRRLFFTFTLLAYLCLFLFYFPSKLAALLYPKLFPLNLVHTDLFYQIPMDIFLLNLLFPITLRFFRPVQAFRYLFVHWISIVGSKLGLLEFLISEEELQQIDQPERQEVEIQQQNIVGQQIPQQQETLNAHQNVGQVPQEEETATEEIIAEGYQNEVKLEEAAPKEEVKEGEKVGGKEDAEEIDILEGKKEAISALSNTPEEKEKAETGEDDKGKQELIAETPSENNEQAIGPVQYEPRIEEEANANTRPNNFALKITAFIILLSFSFTIVFSLVFSVPIFLARNTICLFFGRRVLISDIYCFFMGLLSTIFLVAMYPRVERKLAHNHVTIIKHLHASLLFKNLLYFLPKILSLFFLSSVWIVCIPFAVGLLMEKTFFVPMRVFSMEETPIYFYYQDWAIGILIVKIWYQLSRVTTMPVFSHPSVHKFVQEIERQGFLSSLNFENTVSLIFEVGFPLLCKLLVVLLSPLVFIKGLFALIMGYTESTVAMIEIYYRFIYMAMFVGTLLTFLISELMNCAKDLHTKLRDEKYLLGKELNNYDNARKQEELQQEKKEEKIKVD